MKLLHKYMYILLLPLFFSSCSDTNDYQDISNDHDVKTTIDDYLEADMILTSGIEQMLLHINQNPELNYTGTTVEILPVNSNNEMPLVEVEPQNTNTLIILDFGQGKVINGVTHKGAIRALLQGSWWLKGSELTLNFVNYQVGITTANGLLTLSSHGINSNNNSSYSFSARTINLHVQYNNYSLSRTMDRIVTVYNQGTWENLADDWYSITGSGSGVNHEGRDFTTTITKPIAKHLSCGKVTSGEILFRNTGKPAATVDFGNGDCETAVRTIR